MLDGDTGIVSAALSPGERAADAERLEMAVLMDIYGPLLTERQFEMLDMHYNSDLSLSEIAEELSVSRQAAHDGIRKGRALLRLYEEKLGLEKEDEFRENLLEQAGRTADELEREMPGLKGCGGWEQLKRLMEMLRNGADEDPEPEPHGGMHGI